MKTTILENMVDKFREAEKLYLESRTEMAEYSSKQKQQFLNKSKKLKEEARKTMDWLIKKVGVEEEFLNEVLESEGL